MSVDHYAGAARRWAEGATLVYGPIARALIESSPRPLRGRLVLDAGAGTGVASTALAEAGATAVAADFSPDMLAWRAGSRPPAAVADVQSLPLRGAAVDDTVAAFVLNHLLQPVAGFAELGRVTRPGGVILACVYANTNRSEVRDALDRAAQDQGWQAPDWYVDIKRQATPLLGTPESMRRVAESAGLTDVAVAERAVDVGVTTPDQLVDYRLGQAHFAAWLDRMGPDRAEAVRERMVETIRPIMCPYRPVVVFLAALVPPR